MRTLCVMPGDGIGQEVIPAAVRLLRAVAPDLQTETAAAGWDSAQQGRKMRKASAVRWAAWPKRPVSAAEAPDAS